MMSKAELMHRQRFTYDAVCNILSWFDMIYHYGTVEGLSRGSQQFIESAESIFTAIKSDILEVSRETSNAKGGAK